MYKTFTTYNLSFPINTDKVIILLNHEKKVYIRSQKPKCKNPFTKKNQRIVEEENKTTEGRRNKTRFA